MFLRGRFSTHGKNEIHTIFHMCFTSSLGTICQGNQCMYRTPKLQTALEVSEPASDSGPLVRQPDPEAYDEKGASPGRAWVGFSSSTSYFQFQPLRCAAHHAGIGDRAGKVSHTTFELAVPIHVKDRTCLLFLVKLRKLLKVPQGLGCFFFFRIGICSVAQHVYMSKMSVKRRFIPVFQRYSRSSFICLCVYCNQHFSLCMLVFLPSDFSGVPINRSF